MEAIYKLFDDEEETARICRNEGVEIGRAEGIEVGRAEGREEREKDIALELLKDGLDIDRIARIIGLPSETIRKMKEEAGL